MKIMLACAAGMSTSMLVEKMKLAAKELNEELVKKTGIKTVPSVFSIRFIIERIVVDFPAPFGPINPNTSPSCKLRDKSFTPNIFP